MAFTREGLFKIEIFIVPGFYSGNYFEFLEGLKGLNVVQANSDDNRVPATLIALDKKGCVDTVVDAALFQVFQVAYIIHVHVTVNIPGFYPKPRHDGSKHRVCRRQPQDELGKDNFPHAYRLDGWIR